MNKAIIFITLLLMISISQADSSDQCQQLKILQRHLRVKKALMVLIQEGAITLPEGQCPVIEPSLLEELRLNGTVKPSDGVDPDSICVVPMS